MAKLGTKTKNKTKNLERDLPFNNDLDIEMPADNTRVATRNEKLANITRVEGHKLIQHGRKLMVQGAKRALAVGNAAAAGRAAGAAIEEKQDNPEELPGHLGKGVFEI